MATIRDVAKESGVSVATVSYVLNNGPRPVSASARQRVTAAVQRLNYHPNSVARSLVRRRTYCLGVLLGAVEPEVVTNAYYAGVFAGIFAQAQMMGYDIRILTSQMGKTGSEHQIRAQQHDGVLCLAPPQGDDLPLRLRAAGVPVVTVASASYEGITCIDVDNPVGTRLAMEHLMQLGHRRVAYLMSSVTVDSALQRRQTYEDVLREWGIEPLAEDIIGREVSWDGAYQAMRERLQQPAIPTAVFAFNDGLAMQAIRAIRDEGLCMPEEVSVVGYDDAPLSAYLAPGLTTVRQPLQEIGQKGVKKLVQLIEGQIEPGSAHLFAPELIVRGSTAPALRPDSERRNPTAF